MFDFLIISEREKKKGTVEIFPKFRVGEVQDLMIRGGDFYAAWIDEKKMWTTNENWVTHKIDLELEAYVEKNREKLSYKYNDIQIAYMWDSSTRMIDNFHQYCKSQLRDNATPLDEKLIFADQETNKKDFCSKKLGYSLSDGEAPCYEKIISTLYSEDERYKIEWAIGCVLSGESIRTQKFLVLYGPPGTGKGTILEIIMRLFEGYYSIFDAESLGSNSATFALEQFKSNPLVAISPDGDLSRIEKNTTINSLVSHEKLTVNEKHKSLYVMKFISFLFMGTNKPVKITDAKSGLIRRLIDVYPTGNKIPIKEYNQLMKGIWFELGMIAKHCLELYLNDPEAFDDYKPTLMMGESNDFFNFVSENFNYFKKENAVTLRQAWDMYKEYVQEAKVPYPLSMRVFKIELKAYFTDYAERTHVNDDYVRNYYSGFKTALFEREPVVKPKEDIKPVFVLKEQTSKFDEIFKDCPAQLANSEGTPTEPWVKVTTTLKDIDTRKVHYVRPPENLIVIDFDMKDEEGNKSLEKNLKAANSWPLTYAETSKSGGGLHLHYYWKGDVSKLSTVFADHIEIKVFKGKSSLRRALTLCNDEDIVELNTGLPMKEEKLVLNGAEAKSAEDLRRRIINNLNKMYHPATKPSMDYIYYLLEDAYSRGMKYDVTDLYGAIFAFAMNSTNNSSYCMNLCRKLKLKSDESVSWADPGKEKPIIFFDCEVFPNLFLVNYKKAGDKKCIRMINPTPDEITKFMYMGKLIGFNCRRYDNHIVYARHLGYSNQQLYELSKRIITGDKKAFFGDAYNLSWTDIYDYATKKQSLKKYEIDLRIKHKELGFDWDKDVPEEKWEEVSEYCDNDVISTEATFNATQEAYMAREILADISGMTVNDTTNSLTTRIIFGAEKNPPLVYTHLDTGEQEGTTEQSKFKNSFPGYSFVKKWDPDKNTFIKQNMYRGIDLGFGGYVYSEPGMYTNVALLDVASMHPHSIIAMNCFGPYTKRFEDLVETRIDIKHSDYVNAAQRFDGKLSKYLSDKEQAGKLAGALKIPINSVYGLTSAAFDNPFRDKRNENNIVALRGALFMKTLQDEVNKRGFTVAHIKTDSIKIPNATPEIIQFCMKFAKEYGYTFEHEATYEKMCLVNDAVYIAKYATVEHCEELYGKEYVQSEKDICKDCKKHGGDWTATGTQFAVPFVFKTLFTKEDITFDDVCETKEVKTAMYLQDPNNPDIVQFVGKVGLFCPVKEGKILVRQQDKKDGIGFNAVTGTKGYQFLQAEDIQPKDGITVPDCINLDYYRKLVDDAKDAISLYGDVETFCE